MSLLLATLQCKRRMYFLLKIMRWLAQAVYGHDQQNMVGIVDHK